MARKWTEEERKKQAEAIRRWKPWENSTGPKTAAGKERCRLNAYKTGLHGVAGDALRESLRLNKQFVKHAQIWAEYWLRAEEVRRQKAFRTDYKGNQSNQ